MFSGANVVPVCLWQRLQVDTLLDEGCQAAVSINKLYPLTYHETPCACLCLSTESSVSDNCAMLRQTEAEENNYIRDKTLGHWADINQQETHRAAMKSLRFLAAEGFVQSGASAQENLGCVPVNLYPLLFKACYIHEQADLLHVLVQTWPLHELNLHTLLGKTRDCQMDLTSRTCRLCLTALLTGLKVNTLSRADYTV